MRNRMLAIVGLPLLVCAVSLGIACTPVAPRTTPAVPGNTPLGLVPLAADDEDERAIYVSLPVNNDVTSAEWRKYRDARLVGHRASRRCVDRPDPVSNQCQRVVPVEIGVVEGSKEFDAEAPPNQPQLVAWIENPNASDTHDGFSGRRGARYAVVMGARGDANSKDVPNSKERAVPVYVIEFRFVFGDTEPHSARARVYGHAYYCHKYAKPYKSDFYFAPCKYHRPGPSAERSERGQVLVTSLTTSTLRTYYLDDPMWFSCNSGCCTSDYPA